VANENLWSRYRETLRRAESGELDHASEAEKRGAISDLIEMSCTTTTALALQPFPGIDSAFVTPIHTRMIAAIGRVRGYHLDPDAAYHDVLEPLGEQLLISHLAIAAAKLLPFLDMVGTAMAYGLTCATGDVGAEYYRRGRAMDRREMKARFQRTYRKSYGLAFREKRSELFALFYKPEVRQRIQQLKKARREGTVRADEVADRMDEILRQG
jgi:uncharacterized protein (DUF697 family)